MKKIQIIFSSILLTGSLLITSLAQADIKIGVSFKMLSDVGYKHGQLIKDTVGVAGTKVFSSPLINSNSNLNSTLDVEFQIWDLTSEDYVTEGSEEDMMTEGGSSENLITEIVGLDLAASNVVTSSIGT